jgi:hypothetical protein
MVTIATDEVESARSWRRSSSVYLLRGKIREREVQWKRRVKRTNRAHWQLLAEERVLDANALLASGRWSAAYHLAGYAVECWLKACILALVENQNGDLIFRERRFSEKCWTHNFDELVQLAGHRTALDLDRNTNRQLEINWAYAIDWEETSRYSLATQFDAHRLYQAITDPQNIFLPWIRTQW